MTKFRTYRTIENDVWKVTFINDSMSEADRDLMEKFGEPEINLGGTYGSSPNQFTLPDKYAKIRSDFPYTAEFDANDTPFDTNTGTKVSSYETGVITKITDALTTLRTNSDSFTGEQVYNL